MRPTNGHDLPSWTSRQVVGGTLVVIAVGIGFWLLYRFNIVVISLILAIFISVALDPAVDRLQRHGISRGGATGLVYLALLGAALCVVAVLLPLVLDQGSELALGLPDHYSALRNLLQDSPSRMIRQLGVQLPPHISIIPATPNGEADLDLVARLLDYGSILLKGFLITGGVLLLAFYWTLDQERAIRSILLLAPPETRNGLREFFETVRTRVGEYVRGVGVLCLLVGGLSFGVFAIVGLPNALVLAILAGLFEAIPLVGPTLGALPAVLVAASFEPSRVLWVVVGALAIQALENTILVPRVMRRAVGVNPFVSLLALATFGSLFGVPGALLAIPMAAVLQLVLRRLLLEPSATATQAGNGRDMLNVLQLETRKLIGDVQKQIRSNRSRLDEPTDEIEDGLEAIATDLDSVLSRATSEGSSA